MLLTSPLSSTLLPSLLESLLTGDKKSRSASRADGATCMAPGEGTREGECVADSHRDGDDGEVIALITKRSHLRQSRSCMRQEEEVVTPRRLPSSNFASAFYFPS